MSNKLSKIESLLEHLSGEIGTPRSVAFSTRTCVMCSGEASEFRDEASRREYDISGMCQKCQDRFFGEVQ